MPRLYPYARAANQYNSTTLQTPTPAPKWTSEYTRRRDSLTTIIFSEYFKPNSTTSNNPPPNTPQPYSQALGKTNRKTLPLSIDRAVSIQAIPWSIIFVSGVDSLTPSKGDNIHNPLMMHPNSPRWTRMAPQIEAQAQHIHTILIEACTPDVKRCFWSEWETPISVPFHD